MSLTTALATANTGLSVNSRRADVTANNIANASTEGYKRRDVELAAQVAGGQGTGVYVASLTVESVPALTNQRRDAAAELSYRDQMAQGQQQLARLIGGPDDPGSLFAGYDAFEAALRELSNAPQSTASQLDVLSTAKNIADDFNGIQDGLDDMRARADSDIARATDEINRLLVSIKDVNEDIVKLSALTSTTVEVEAQRDELIDELQRWIPLELAPKDNGAVHIFSKGGVQLVGGSFAAELTFTEAPVVTPAMDLVGGAPGSLSTLTINGLDYTPSTDPQNRLGGGGLAALFELRDVTSVTAQTRVDAMASDLITRFADAGVEPNITAGDPGFFTDGGAAPTPALTAGLAGRLSINAAVDPDQGGSLLAIRDGIGAPAGDAGDNTHAIALLGAMTSANTAPAGSDLNGSKSATAFAADFATLFSSESQNAETSLALRQSQFDIYYAAEQGAVGVDLDRELQELTLIQTAYSANARVIEVVNVLFQRLMEI